MTVEKEPEEIQFWHRLKLPQEMTAILEQSLNDETQPANGRLVSLLANELHSALVESSKNCLHIASPVISHLCHIVNDFYDLEEPDPIAKSKAEFSSATILTILPSITVATLLYGSTAQSLLEPSHSNVTSAPPSPSATCGTISTIFQFIFKKYFFLESFNFGSGSPSASATTTVHHSPEFLLQYALFLLSSRNLVSLANSVYNPKAATQQQQQQNPNSSSAALQRTAAPPSPQQPNSNLSSVHHFASLVAPSVYHNPVLFGASFVSDNSQTEHHQRERKVRIQTSRMQPQVVNIISSFNPKSNSQLQPGLVAPLVLSALSEFNRYNAIQMDGSTAAILRCCDAALRLLSSPVSSPVLQAVSPAIVIQFIYLAGIASASIPYSHIDFVWRKDLKSGDNQKCEFQVEPAGSDDDDDESLKMEAADEKQLCRLQLLAVIHAGRTLAELRLWPDVLAVARAVENTSGLAIDLAEVEAGNLVLSQPTSTRAITNASFRAKKLPDDIDATVDQQGSSTNKHSTPTPKKSNDQKEEQQDHHTSSHHSSSGKRNLTLNPSHLRGSKGKHAAAIASLQAAFRLPERLRSRRRSYGVDTTLNPAATPPMSSKLTSRQKESISASLVAAPSFSMVEPSPEPHGPRLELRILDDKPSVSNLNSSVGGDLSDDQHSDMPMIDDKVPDSGHARSRTNSYGQLRPGISNK